MRGITPALFNLFRLILEVENEIDLSEYTKVGKGHVEYWDADKLGADQTGNEIFDLMKTLVASTHITLDNNHWDSYRLMNEKIIRSLSGHSAD